MKTAPLERQPVSDRRQRRGSLLVRVDNRVRLIAHRTAPGVLDGQHRGIHAGRSFDFEDLREYVAGDDVKDLDWKATARHGAPLVRRYVAQRQHSVLLAVDTGRSLAALADANATKRDVVVMAAGMLGRIATDGGDRVGLIAANEARSTHIPFGTGNRHLERILREVDESISLDGPPSRLTAVLDDVVRTIRRRTICVVVADDRALSDSSVAALRRLSARHEVLFCVVADADFVATGSAAAGHVVGTGATVTAGRLPAFLRTSAVGDDLHAAAANRHAERSAALARLGITSVVLRGEDATPASVHELLERHRRARRRS